MQGFLLSFGLLSRSQVFLPAWYPTTTTASVFFLIAFGLLRALSYMLKNHVGSLTQLTFACQQRTNLLSLGLKNAQSVSSKELVTLFTEIITQSANVVSNLALIINIACTSVLFFVSGIKLAPIEMILGVSLLACFIFPLKFMTRKINAYGSGTVAEWENVSGALLRGLKNYFFLTIYKQIDFEIKKGTENLENFKEHYKSYSLVVGFAGAFPVFVGVTILSLITFVSNKYIHTDPMKLVSFFYLFIRLAQTAGEASTTVSNLRLNMPAFKKLFEWNQKFSAMTSLSSRKSIEIKAKNITIEANNLTFGYEKNVPLFKDLSFSISPSDVLVIKGESGAGKSTLLSLILGLNLPQEGEVKINSYSSKFFEADLHHVLAYVGPEPYLIQGTVRENLFYGLEESSIPESALWDALQAVELKELVEGLQFKLDEPIYDIPQLSTGQKQRLSFARALTRKPSLLILDEATANLDSITEKKIIANLDQLFKSCTTVIVTHKNSFDELATQKIKLGR
jgi:ATP-binding cassette subfamily C protein